MATRRPRGNTDRWEHKRLTLPDGRVLGWTVDPDGPTILHFFRMEPTEGMRLLRQSGHPDAELPGPG